MKKDYLRPEVEIIDIITSTLMSTSINQGEDNKDPAPGDAGNHRGEWGNIWGDME